ncbi:hypothetical protein QVN60_04915 [Yersinia aleksiciae]|uniref:hypothetical protein n=1 Tax=Yersinia aleksiciae TaxID=263819 RepID=UPI0011A74172|nr:hypothetical protein [Yersinia aleksiciae]MDN0122549.1 hypothetical protein [Yersinia aleksiciae]
MRIYKKVIFVSMLIALPVTSALACFHQPNCFKNCDNLPLWEVPFCDLGSQHKQAFQSGDLKNPIELDSLSKTNYSDNSSFNVNELYRL